MAEQTEDKKKKKTLRNVLIILLVLLLFGGSLTAVLLGRGKEPVEEPTASETGETEESVPESTEGQDDPGDGNLVIYYNFERENYAGKASTGLTARTPNKDDGYYHMLFATNGRTVTRRIADYKLANQIDQEDLLGLVTDENGIVIGMKKIEEFTGGYEYYGHYISENKGDGKLLLNSSETLNGMDVDYEIPAGAKIYDVSKAATAPGMELKASDLLQHDCIHTIKDLDGNVFAVYVISRKLQYPVYWNKDRMYDAELLKTTRTPNEDGEFVFEMACGGGPVTVKTKSQDVANQIDGYPAHLMGLVFDEEGYVTGTKGGKATCGGPEVSSWYTVIETDATSFTSEKMSDPYKGTKYFGTKSSDFKAYDVTGETEVFGEARDLRIGDQIHAVCDYSGNVCVAFIVNSRHTAYCPHCGKEVDFKLWDYVVGAILDSGHYYIKQDLYMKSQLAIGSTLQGNYNVILDMNGHNIIGNKGSRAIVVLGENCSLFVYDSSEKHTSSITANGDITNHMNTTVSAPMWVRCGSMTVYGVPMNFSASRSSATDAKGSAAITSGIYVSKGAKLNLIGTSVVGTKAARGGAILSDGDVVLNSTIVRGGVATEDGGGIYLTSSASLKLMGSSVVNANKNSDGESSNVFVSKGATIYVDNSFKNTPGAVKVTGHYKGVFTDGNGAAKQAAIVSDSSNITIEPSEGGTLSFTHIGAMDHPHVMGTKADIDAKNGEEAVFERWESTTSLPQGDGYYYLASNVTLSGAYTPAEGADVHICFNGHTVTAAGGGNRMMTGLTSYDSNTKVMTTSNHFNLSFCDCQDCGGVTTVANKNAADNQGSLFWFCGQEETLNIYGGTFTVGENFSSTANGSLICLEGKNNVFNMYGGTVKNGITTKYGANLHVGNTNTFNLYGGTIEGGNASSGGNIRMSGTANLIGGTVKNGVAANGGGNIFADSGAVINLKGTEILGGQATGSSGSGWYYGGNVAMNPDTTFKMSSGTIANGSSAGVGGNLYINGIAEITGGEIKNGTTSHPSKDIFLDGYASVTHKGGEIGVTYVNKTSKMILGGGKATIILTVTATEDTLTADPAGIASDAKYDLQFVNAGILVKNGAAAIANFTIPEGEYTLQAKDGNLVAAAETADAHKHCICGGIDKEGHTCADHEWLPWTETTRLPGTGLAAGEYYYYLTKDLDGVAATNAPTGVTVHLCLNGFTVTGKTGDRIFQNNGTANNLYTICDCSEEHTGKFVGKATFGGQGGMFWASVATSTLEFYGVTIDATATNLVKSGSGAGYGAAIAVDNGTVKMVGCTVKGGTHAGPGGQICLCNAAKFNAKDCTFEGGKTTGGTGGNFYAESTSSITLKDCTVKGGQTLASGKTGGNFYITSKATLVIEGGSVENGIATECGGNLWVGTSVPVTLKDVEFIGGTARYGGSIGVDRDYAIVNLTNCSVKNGVANFSYGGNIYFNSGAMTFTNCTVTGGQCTGPNPNGPNIYVGSSANVTYNNTTISN